MSDSHNQADNFSKALAEVKDDFIAVEAIQAKQLERSRLLARFMIGIGMYQVFAAGVIGGTSQLEHSYGPWLFAGSSVTGVLLLHQGARLAGVSKHFRAELENTQSLIEIAEESPLYNLL